MNTKMKILLASLLTTTIAFAGDGGTAGSNLLPTDNAGTSYGGISVTNVNSPHNIGGQGNVATNAASGEDNDEVCVYCHTPHAANTAFAGAPIWNKKTMASTAFTMYGSTVAMANGTGTAAIDAEPNDPSLACLSCHDGVSGVDSIVNAPGSGMRSEVNNGTTIIAMLTTAYGGNIGDAGSATLANDHPVSITYTGSGEAGVADSFLTSAASLRKSTETLPLGTSGDKWVTPGGGTTVASLLRNTKVECSSCHDPHNATGVPQASAAQVNYLRHTNTRSELCFGCHQK